MNPTTIKNLAFFKFVYVSFNQLDITLNTFKITLKEDLMITYLSFKC